MRLDGARTVPNLGANSDAEKSRFLTAFEMTGKGLAETEIGHYSLEVRSWKLEVGIRYAVAIRRSPPINDFAQDAQT